MLHSVLESKAEELGSRAQLASMLGVSTQVLSRWINLKGVPPSRPRRGWTLRRIRQFRKKVERLFGEDYEAVFPSWLTERSALVLYGKTKVQSVDVSESQNRLIERKMGERSRALLGVNGRQFLSTGRVATEAEVDRLVSREVARRSKGVELVPSARLEDRKRRLE